MDKPVVSSEEYVEVLLFVFARTKSFHLQLKVMQILSSWKDAPIYSREFLNLFRRITWKISWTSREGASWRWFDGVSINHAYDGEIKTFHGIGC